MRFQKGSQILIPAVDGIGHYPGERDLRFPETFDHLAGQLAFRLKAHRVGNPCLSAPFGIPDPSQGQIQFAIQEGVAFRAGVSEEHPDLAIFQVARRAAMLPGHPRGLVATLAKTRFVDHQDRVRITQAL